MITYIAGDLFQSPAKVLVNTVNTVGVMGKGIASDFKKIYPDMFHKYQMLCEKNQFHIGQLWLYKTPNKWVLNFPMKQNWRQKSHPEYIELGLEKFASSYDEKGINSISFPQLGCGNGELDWSSQVQPLMEKYLQPLPITIYIHIYEKKDVPERLQPEEIRQWLHGEPENLAFSEFWNDIQKLITSRQRFKTLDKAVDFEVKLSNDKAAIEILAGKKAPISIVKGDYGFLDLWQYVRTAGYCMPDKLPAGLDKFSSYIVSILAELDYMRPVGLSRVDGQQQIGLQLVPKVGKPMNSSSKSNVITLA